MKHTLQKLSDGLLVCLLVLACIGVCILFWILPFRALDTGLVYRGF
jgi:hypothetical protein